MIDNKPYWDNKEYRHKHAITHTKEMERVEPKPTNILYGGDDRQTVKAKDSNKEVSSEFLQADTVYAVAKVSRKFRKPSRICVLNFASYRNPGGGFLKGSGAQEECLCHASNLFNALRECQSFYDWNEGRLNRSLYTDRAIYTKDVTFFVGNEAFICDVLTCAAPNYGSANKNYSVGADENAEVLEQRVEFIKNIMVEQGVDVAILGAFGCGVFRQDAELVAHTFKHIFNKHCGINTVYAVPGAIHKENFDAFRKVFD